MTDNIKWTKGSVDELKRWLAESEHEELIEAQETRLDYPWPITIKEQRTVWGSATTASVQTTLAFDDVPDAEDYEIRLAIIDDAPQINPGAGGTGGTPGTGDPNGGNNSGRSTVFYENFTSYPWNSQLMNVSSWEWVSNYSWTLFTPALFYVFSPDGLTNGGVAALVDAGDQTTYPLPELPGFFTQDTTAAGPDMSVEVHTLGAQSGVLVGEGTYTVIYFSRNNATGKSLLAVCDHSYSGAYTPDAQPVSFSLYLYDSGTYTQIGSTVSVAPMAGSWTGNNINGRDIFTASYDSASGTSISYGGVVVLSDPNTYSGLGTYVGFTMYGYSHTNLQIIDVNAVSRITSGGGSTGNPGGGGGIPYVPGSSVTTKKVFAHYTPEFPLSLDNNPPASDFYQNAYLTPTGESGKHTAYGGLLRDRPVGVSSGTTQTNGWTMVWNDEFTGSSVDSSKWNVRNNTTQNNMMGRNFAANVTVSGGMLSIRSGTDNAVDPSVHPWTCGYLDTIGKMSYAYGRWEARMRFPWGAAGQGYWPAFWLRPDDGGNGEVDIMEAWPGKNDVHQSLWKDYSGTPHAEGPHKGTPSFDPTQWHVYAVEVEADSLKFYTDDVLVWDATNAVSWRKATFDRGAKWNIRLNLQIGQTSNGTTPGYGGWPDGGTVLSGTMDVDYVRYYQRATTTQTTTDWPGKNASTEIGQAKDAGIDGFMCKIMALTTTNNNNRKFQDAMFTSAAADGAFYCIPMIDCATLSGATDDQLADTINDYLTYSCNYQISSEYVVGAISAASLSPTRFANIKSILSSTYSKTVKLVLVFDSYTTISGGTYDSVTYAYSLSGDRNPTSNTVATGAGTPKQHIADVQGGGFLWMQPVSVQGESPKQSIYEESENTLNLLNTWDIAINGNADWVHIMTWNDYAAGSQTAPSVNHGWAYIDVCSYYIDYYKYGAAPTLTQDALYLTHRIQTAADTSTFTETSPMTLKPGGSSARDKVECLVFAKAAGSVAINSGGTITTTSVSAGVTSVVVNWNPGTISAAMTRGGVSVANITSPFTATITPYVQDLQYYASSNLRIGYASGGSGSGSPMPTVDPAGWTRVYEEDFTTDLGLGTFVAGSDSKLISNNPYTNSIKMYPSGTLDTSRSGQFSPEKTALVSNSSLRINMHMENGTPYGCAVMPVLPAGFKYGRIDVCMRLGSVFGFKCNSILYPDSNNISEGAISWPFSDSIGYNLSGVLQKVGGGTSTNTSTEGASSWHVYTMEWTAGVVKFFLDGVQVGSNLTTGVPSTPLHWILQFETSTVTPPAVMAANTVEIDWIVAYK